MPAAKKPTPRAPLTPEAIARAAIALADQHGIAAVSMRSTASALGVQAMSLYHSKPGPF